MLRKYLYIIYKSNLPAHIHNIILRDRQGDGLYVAYTYTVSYEYLNLNLYNASTAYDIIQNPALLLIMCVFVRACSRFLILQSAPICTKSVALSINAHIHTRHIKMPFTRLQFCAIFSSSDKIATPHSTNPSAQPAPEPTNTTPPISLQQQPACICIYAALSWTYTYMYRYTYIAIVWSVQHTHVRGALTYALAGK